MEGRQTSSVGDARPEGEDGSPALLFHIFPSPAMLEKKRYLTLV